MSDKSEVAKTFDAVARPPGYNQGSIETIQLIKYRNYMVGNVAKYVIRHRFKGGRQDLAKARQYLRFILDIDPRPEAVLPEFLAGNPQLQPEEREILHLLFDSFDQDGSAARKALEKVEVLLANYDEDKDDASIEW